MIDIFTELTSEQKEILEQLNSTRAHLREIKDEMYLVTREIENYRETKGASILPAALWAFLAVCEMGLFVLYLLVNYSTTASIAIALVAGVPLLFIFFVIMFIRSIRKYNLATAQDPAGMAKAAELGIENQYALIQNARKRYEKLEAEKKHLETLLEELEAEFDEKTKNLQQ